MSQSRRTTTRVLPTLLIFAAAGVIARAEEPHSGDVRQQSDSGKKVGGRAAPASGQDSADIDATEFFTGQPPTGTSYHDAPDGPALISHTSLQRRLFKNPPKLDEPQNSMAHFYINLFHLSHADFKLAGQVVDDTAQPVRDVQMTVTAAQLTNIWTGGTKTEIVRQKLTDGVFSIELKGYREVEVAFEKEGLRREVYEPQLADPDPKDLNIDRLTQRKKPKIRHFTQDQLRIVLAKPRRIVPLYHFRSTLVWRSDDSGGVADFGLILGSKGLSRTVANLHANEELPSGCLMFLPARDADGNVVLDGKSDDMLPVSVDLRVNDKDGGLQLFESDDGSATLDQIIEAPEDGYAAQLTLAGKQLRDRCCFFVRTRDRYAKCRIESVNVTRDEGLEIAIVVTIKYQRRPTRYMNELP